MLTGGFPCQPFSLAGKRLGTEDERHLWPEMLRAIRDIRPRWIVGENVLGIVSWNDGMVFEQVCADLEAEGYEVQPFVLPATGAGALHMRNRTWFIAHAQCVGLSADPLRPRNEPERDVQPVQKFASLMAVTAHDARAESHKHGVVDGLPVGLDECSIKAYGNAVVPQIPLQIFKAINQYENLTNEC